jgi:hypothetical protein
MTLKRTVLLAVMALTAVAFAAPAAQAMAPQWYSNGNTLNELAEFHIEGELATPIPATGFTSGPCEVTFEGTAKNENGMAGGTVNSIEIQEECETNVSGCTVTPTVNIPAAGWNITGITVTGTTGVEIQGATFTNDYMGACPLAQASASGTVTGIVTNGGSTISFEGHADDLRLEPPLPALAVDLEGVLHITTAGLTLN